MKSIKCLKYDYIEGEHRPKNVHQFAEIVNALAKLHTEDYVHGDIRKKNLLFSRNGINAWMIDFDIAGKESTLYPSTYNHRGIDERHS